MLVKLSMKNFKSYMEQTEIDLNATGYEILNDTNKTNDNILKGALFVGGNATGKSTVLKAIRFLLELLVWQINIMPFNYLCFFKEAKGKMKLEYEFFINREFVNYEIECDEKGISKERLCVSNKEIINRIGQNGIYIRDDEQEIAIEKLQFNQSAVRKVYFDTKFIDNTTLMQWFEFLEQSVFVDQFGKNIFKSSGSSSIITYKDYFEKNGVNNFNKFLNEIDYNQTLEYTNEFNNGKLKFNFDNNQKDIIVKRNEMDFALPVNMESDGNQTIVNILPIIFDAMNNGGMVIIDEFSSGFHNILEEKVIKYFMKNSKTSQIFIVSHSTNLLSNTLLRPDQIYTVDFINGKGSKVYRVSDSKPREAQNIEKMYLSGVFNGLPNIK